MLLYLLKKQLRAAILFTILFCSILILQMNASWEGSYNGQYYDAQVDYLAQHDLVDRDEFFLALAKDTDEINKQVSDIEEFMAYEGDVPEGVVNPLDVAANGSIYMDYDMVIWRQNMLNLPGKFTDSISGDKQMLEALSGRLNYTQHINSILDNHKEIAARGIRRGGSNTYKYELALAELQSISTDFSVEDVAFTQNFLDYMQEDWYFIILIAVLFFGTFSTVLQQRIAWPVSVSQMGARKYALLQIFATMITAVVVFALYHTGVLLACSFWQPTEMAWSLPIQCLSGDLFDSYDVILNLNVWEYTLVLLAQKCLFCMLLSSIILFVSLLSCNNTIAAVCTFIVCGTMILLHTESSFGGVLIGNTSCLLDGLCWTNVGGITVSYSTIYVFIVSVLVIVISILSVLLSKPVLRRCSK